MVFAFSSLTDSSGRLWTVPRRFLCGLFWIAVILVFSGKILLVTSNHKGRTSDYGTWGLTLLLLGICALLVGILFCLVSYRAMTRRNNLLTEADEDKDENTGNNLQSVSRQPLIAPPTYHHPTQHSAHVTSLFGATASDGNHLPVSMEIPRDCPTRDVYPVGVSLPEEYGNADPPSYPVTRMGHGSSSASQHAFLGHAKSTGTEMPAFSEAWKGVQSSGTAMPLGVSRIRLSKPSESKPKLIDEVEQRESSKKQHVRFPEDENLTSFRLSEKSEAEKTMDEQRVASFEQLLRRVRESGSELDLELDELKATSELLRKTETLLNGNGSSNEKTEAISGLYNGKEYEFDRQNSLEKDNELMFSFNNEYWSKQPNREFRNIFKRSMSYEDDGFEPDTDGIEENPRPIELTLKEGEHRKLQQSHEPSGNGHRPGREGNWAIIPGDEIRMKTVKWRLNSSPAGATRFDSIGNREINSNITAPGEYFPINSKTIAPSTDSFNLTKFSAPSDGLSLKKNAPITNSFNVGQTAPSTQLDRFEVLTQPEVAGKLQESNPEEDFEFTMISPKLQKKQIAADPPKPVVKNLDDADRKWKEPSGNPVFTSRGSRSSENILESATSFRSPSASKSDDHLDSNLEVATNRTPTSGRKRWQLPVRYFSSGSVTNRIGHARVTVTPLPWKPSYTPDSMGDDGDDAELRRWPSFWGATVEDSDLGAQRTSRSVHEQHPRIMRREAEQDLKMDFKFFDI